jgi:hypothetical protein
MAFAAMPPSLQIVPQPREVRAAGAGFEPAKARFICVSADAADRFTARLLREALRETHGLDGNVVLLPPQATNRHRLWLGSSEPLPEVPERLKDKRNESYTLDVTGGGVLISAELRKRCEVLLADTRLIADEMDELAHGAVGKLIWEGAGTDKVSVATAADTTGYHKVLASLSGFQERLRQAADSG